MRTLLRILISLKVEDSVAPNGTKHFRRVTCSAFIPERWVDRLVLRYYGDMP